MSDVGAIRHMFPVKYTPKKDEGTAGDREPRRDPPKRGPERAVRSIPKKVEVGD